MYWRGYCQEKRKKTPVIGIGGSTASTSREKKAAVWVVRTGNLFRVTGRKGPPASRKEPGPCPPPGASTSSSDMGVRREWSFLILLTGHPRRENRLSSRRGPRGKGKDDTTISIRKRGKNFSQKEVDGVSIRGLRKIRATKTLSLRCTKENNRTGA